MLPAFRYFHYIERSFCRKCPVKLLTTIQADPFDLSVDKSERLNTSERVNVFINGKVFAWFLSTTFMQRQLINLI